MELILNSLDLEQKLLMFIENYNRFRINSYRFNDDTKNLPLESLRDKSLKNIIFVDYNHRLECSKNTFEISPISLKIIELDIFLRHFKNKFLQLYLMILIYEPNIFGRGNPI